MKNKVFKYIKVLISAILILGLVAPSYASLSASDGSAFVTKAEFDSALADFNSRLTTFEAGINSKIDSQVTSYLDRNGIWNGKLAKVTNNTCIFFAFGGKSTYQKNYTLTKGTNGWMHDTVTVPLCFNVTLPTFGMDSMPAANKGRKTAYYYGSKVLIQEVEKSGLILWNWQIHNSAEITGGSEKRQYLSYDVPSVSTPFCLHDGGFACRVTSSDPGWPAGVRQDIDTIDTIGFLRTPGMWITKEDSGVTSKRICALYFGVTSGQFLCFVNKGQTISACYSFEISPSTTGGYLNSFVSAASEQCGSTFWFDTPKIY